MEIIHSSVKEDVNGCWVWQKSTSSAGYGQITVNKQYWSTHRYVYTKCFGEIGDGNVIRHLCHNTKCCNPDHLAEGSHKDNWNDSEDTHIESQKQRRKLWLIDGTPYPTLREANKITGISQSSIVKYTDTCSRVFNLSAYREACVIAGWKPKI